MTNIYHSMDCQSIFREARKVLPRPMKPILSDSVDGSPTALEAKYASGMDIHYYKNMSIYSVELPATPSKFREKYTRYHIPLPHIQLESDPISQNLPRESNHQPAPCREPSMLTVRKPSIIVRLLGRVRGPEAAAEAKTPRERNASGLRSMLQRHISRTPAARLNFHTSAQEKYSSRRSKKELSDLGNGVVPLPAATHIILDETNGTSRTSPLTSRESTIEVNGMEPSYVSPGMASSRNQNDALRKSEEQPLMVITAADLKAEMERKQKEYLARKKASKQLQPDQLQDIATLTPSGHASNSLPRKSLDPERTPLAFPRSVSIRGSVVHDFSAPRPPRRSTTFVPSLAPVHTTLVDEPDLLPMPLSIPSNSSPDVPYHNSEAIRVTSSDFQTPSVTMTFQQQLQANSEYWTRRRLDSWLIENSFSQEWISTFRALNINGSTFLELGSGHGGRGNFGMMHQQIYPRLAKECVSSGVGWDQAREREEGKRMRRLIRRIVTGRNVASIRPDGSFEVAGDGSKPVEKVEISDSESRTLMLDQPSLRETQQPTKIVDHPRLSSRITSFADLQVPPELF